MPVNVDEIVSNVQPEPEPASGGAPTEPEWKQAAQTRRLVACIRRDAQRTAADGFDD
ncbi:MAG TPA: hypothetical protein VHV31_07655 [Nitrolancea sp.]|jgi:hypothetical protein|nr:hypothetical protein [Nitrolancea sp.]